MRTNEEWLRDLRSDGARQADALHELRERILRAMCAYVARDHVRSPFLTPETARQLAEDCAQDTLLTIQDKLDTFRGESRFITWATTIALRNLLGELRRRRWKDVSIEQSRIGEELPGWPIDGARSQDPERIFQQDEIWRKLREVINEDLTPRQRFVLVANVFQGMPLDLVADRLGSNRDNVYKLIHDSRKKLKRSLTERGLRLEEILRIFEMAR